MARRYTGGFIAATEQATDSNTANGIFTLAEAQEKTALGSFPTGRFTPSRSLRIRGENSAYLFRTPLSAPTSTQKATFSVWVKRGAMDGNGHNLYAVRMTGSQYFYFGFAGDDTFTVLEVVTSVQYNVNTNRKFRDPSAWYHIVVSIDTTQSVASERVRIYVNGQKETSFATASYPSQNYNHTYLGSTSYTHSIGWAGNNNVYYGAKYTLSQFYCIDGQSLDPSYFAQTDPETAVWVPKLYTGTYGVQGFYLPFTAVNPTSTTNNLLKYSEDFTQTSVWTKSGIASITTNATAAPNGASVAQKLLEDTSTGYHGLYQSFSVSSSTRYTMSIYVKAAERSQVRLVEGNNSISIDYDLTTKTVTASTGSGTITDVGNGWYWLTASGTTGAAQTTSYFDFYMMSGGITGYTGVTNSGMYFWGASYSYTGYGDTVYYLPTTSSQQSSTTFLIAGDASVGGDSCKGSWNNWIAASVSLTNDYSYDWLVDVPGIASAQAIQDTGGLVRGNYPTLNPITGTGANAVYTNGNLTSTNTYSSQINAYANQPLPQTGKWYWEVTCVNPATYGIAVGITTSLTDSAAGVVGSAGIGYYNANGNKYVLGTSSSYGSSWFVSGSTNIIGVAVDSDLGQITFYLNGTSQGVIQFNSKQDWYPGGTHTSGSGSHTEHWNFGQRAFAYTVPTGFKTLNTTNLSNPSIKRPSDHFDIKTYAGNGSSLTVGATAKQTSAIQIPNSLRFKSNAGTYLQRTPLVNGNRATLTWSGWVKRNNLGTYQMLFVAGNDSSNYTNFYWDQTANRLELYHTSSGTNSGYYYSPLSYVNTNSWYHVVCSIDTTATAVGNRVKIYVNGVQQPVTINTGIAQNANLFFNTANTIHTIGKDVSGASQYLDGYLAEVNHIDGQALDATPFGQFDANNNWVPKRYSGSYGTNGYYLPFNAASSYGTSYYATQFTNNQYLSVADNAAFNFGTGSYTIEMMVNTGMKVQSNYYGGYASLIGTYNGTSGWYMHINTAGKIIYGTNGAVELNGSNSIVNDGLWHHIAVVRNGSSAVTVYIDGVANGTATVTNSGYASSPIVIGYLASGYERYFNGIISNVRVTKGVAVYTGNFTVPALPLTATQSSGTNISAITAGQCSLLTCQSSTHIDNSGNNFTITNNNSTPAPVTEYIKATSLFSDYSGNNNHWASSGHSVASPNVLTYGTPGTYTWTAPAGVTSVDYLVVAGGGAGGNSTGGGGGAGGMVAGTLSVTPLSSYTVTVGAGGLSPTLAGASYVGTNGGNSVFATVTATGGGYGACSQTAGGSVLGANANSGGSGGGGASFANTINTQSIHTAGSGTAGQGNAGGASAGSVPYSSGENRGSGAGGGGAGGPGGVADNASTPGNGGPGLTSSITGYSVFYAAGGGGGSAKYEGGFGGIGGGGKGGGFTTGTAAKDGNPGTGSGGGGGGGNFANGMSGGSGIVILKYNNANSYNGTGANSFITQDNIIDVPADYIDSNGFAHANYAVLNKNSSHSYVSVVNNGLTAVATNDSVNNYQATPSTLSVSSGKWYVEYLVNTFASGTNSLQFGVSSYDWMTQGITGNQNGSIAGCTSINLDNSTAAQRDITIDGNITTLAGAGSGVSWSVGDVCGIALDADNKKVYFYKNGTLLNSTPASISMVSPQIWFYGFVRYYTTYSSFTVNFGQTPYKYAAPAGYKSLNTKNIKDVGSYNLPDTFGNFVNTPDLVWTKARSGGAVSPRLYDTVRGPRYSLGTNSTGTSGTETNAGLSEFLPNGFQLYSPNGAAPYGLESGYTYVAWMWNRGQIPGFDIVSYAGTGAVQAINHNLGATPKFIVTKSTSDSTYGWSVYHASVGAGYNLLMNTTAAQNSAVNCWNATSPTSTAFTVGTDAYANMSGKSFIAYLWSEVPGYSKFGSYTGNGSTDGPFVYCGFRPKYIMIKRVDSTGNWCVHDTVRSTYNGTSAELYPNLALTDGTSNGPDKVSNGFKVRDTYTDINASGGTYVYAAFAEAPFKYANAR